MFDATPDRAAKWRATMETSLGRDLAMPNEELLDGRFAVDEE